MLGDKGVSTIINSSQNQKITTIQYKNIGSRSSKSSSEYCMETTLSPNLLETRFSNKWKECCPTAFLWKDGLQPVVYKKNVSLPTTIDGMLLRVL
jgi:hypothetical protein